MGDYFYPLTGTGNGSPPSLITRDRELVSVLEVRIEPGDLNPRPQTPQSVTLPTIYHVLHVIKALQLMAYQPLKGEEFRSLLSVLLCHRGGNRLSRSVNAILRDGTLSVMNGIKIPITQMKPKF